MSRGVAAVLGPGEESRGVTTGRIEKATMRNQTKEAGADPDRLAPTIIDALGAERGAPTPDCVDPVEMLDWIERGPDHPQAGSIQAHVMVCAHCRAEYGRWRQTYRRAAEARAGGREAPKIPPQARQAPQPLGGWQEGLREAFRVPLGVLALRHGAFASGDETRTVLFPVAGSGGRLTGTLLQRHGREYHAKVEADAPGAAGESAGRQVRLTISDPASPQPLLRRVLAVGVLTLLGTLESGYVLTDRSVLEAELLPPPVGSDEASAPDVR